MNDIKLWKQGAEARLHSGQLFGEELIIKERFKKEYRNPHLDEVLSKERLKNEARGLLRCKIAGVKCPTVYNVDVDKRTISLQKVPGLTVKKFLKENHTEREILDMAFLIGECVGKIHSNNLIHGDLTTSNMMIYDDSIYLIDFGLSNVSPSAEDKAVDLYVLERAILSTHEITSEFFATILKSYRKSNKTSKEVLKKYEEVKARGRKRTMIG